MPGLLRGALAVGHPSRACCVCLAEGTLAAPPGVISAAFDGDRATAVVDDGQRRVADRTRAAGPPAYPARPIRSADA